MMSNLDISFPTKREEFKILVLSQNDYIKISKRQIATSKKNITKFCCHGKVGALLSPYSCSLGPRYRWTYTGNEFRKQKVSHKLRTLLQIMKKKKMWDRLVTVHKLGLCLRRETNDISLLVTI